MAGETKTADSCSINGNISDYGHIYRLSRSPSYWNKQVLVDPGRAGSVQNARRMTLDGEHRYRVVESLQISDFTQKAT